MSGASGRDDDFAGLDEAEANELGELADALRRDRFEPEDPDYWGGLQQRIVDQVAVTPLPDATEANAAERPSRAARLWTGLQTLFGADARQRTATVGMGVATALVLTLLILTKDGPQEAIRDQAAPESPIVLTQPQHGGPLSIPNELWRDGFLTNQPLEMTLLSQDTSEDGSDEGTDWGSEAVRAEWDTVTEAENPMLASDWSPGAPWDVRDLAVDDLSDDELVILDGLLDG